MNNGFTYTPNLHLMCFNQPHLQKEIVKRDGKEVPTNHRIFCCSEVTKKHDSEKECVDEWNESNFFSEQDAKFIDRNIKVGNDPLKNRCEKCGNREDHQYKRIMEITCMVCGSKSKRDDLTNDDVRGKGELMLKTTLTHEEGCLVEKAVPHLKKMQINE